jgi:hypothetical protein
MEKGDILFEKEFNMGVIRDHKDLKVYQKAFQLASKIFSPRRRIFINKSDQTLIKIGWK